MTRANKILSKLFEQSWYSDVVPLANKIQSYLLKTGGRYHISKKEIYDTFQDNPEELDQAIEALVRNAALYSAGGDTYYINWSRLSSALL